jgi:hypothetical protein
MADGDYSGYNQSDADRDLINAIDEASQTGYGSEIWGDLANQRALAIDFYLGKNVFPAPEGRSQVVDRTVYETVQWVMPSLTRIFANGDDVVDITPQGPHDEAGADQEAQYLNYLITQKNPWYDIFTTAAKDALMMKAGYLYACRDVREHREVEKYERQTEMGVALLRQDSESEVLSITQYPDDQSPLMQDPMTGRPLPSPMLYDLELRRIRRENGYKIKALPPERCIVSEKTFEVQLKDCPYFEYYDFVSLSDLRADGFDVPDDIMGDTPSSTQEDISRDIYAQRAYAWDSAVDPSLKRVRVRYVWIRHDYDEDGIAELQYAIVVGKTVLYREECNRIPVAVLCADPLPHRHIGLSLADSTMDLQQIKTSMTRGALDNLYLTNNQRTFANGDKINLDDLKISRPGGIVRGIPGKQAVFGQDIAPMATEFVFDKAVMGLQYMDTVRESRTGVNNSFQGLEQNSLTNVQPGTVNQVSTMASQRVEQIARTLSTGIEALASILHELCLKGGHQKDTVKLRGQWVEIDPATWRTRTDFRIKVGYAAGNKDTMLSHLGNIASLQDSAAQGKLPIVNPQNIYETMVEMTKTAGITNPQRFWTDPKTVPPPPPPQPDVTVMAAEQAKTQRDMQTKQMDVAQKERDSQRDYTAKLYQIDADTRVKLHQTHMAHESGLVLESHKALIAHNSPDAEAARQDKAAQRAKGEADDMKAEQMLNAFIEHSKAQQQAHQDHMSQVVGQIAEAVKQLSAPKKVVRDKAGRITHTEPMH